MDKDNDSDIDEVANLDDFKGIYYGDKTEKYIDPDNGCHFRYDDFCYRLTKLKEQRKVIDKRLGLTITSSQVKSPTEQV